MTLIAAVEAYRMVGWESSYHCILTLYEDFEKLRIANEKVSVHDWLHSNLKAVCRTTLSMRMETAPQTCYRFIDPQTNTLSNSITRRFPNKSCCSVRFFCS
jgi:hypothetical protein